MGCEALASGRLNLSLVQGHSGSIRIEHFYREALSLDVWCEQTRKLDKGALNNRLHFSIQCALNPSLVCVKESRFLQDKVVESRLGHSTDDTLLDLLLIVNE